jgi:hypothetical protein
MMVFGSSNRQDDGHATTHVANEVDLDRVCTTLWAAFYDRFGAGRSRNAISWRWWRFLIPSALRYPWVCIRGGYAAAAPKTGSSAACAP